MMLARYTAWTLLAGAGFALFAGGARAQPVPLPAKDGPALAKVNEYRSIPKGGIPKDEMKASKEHFAKFANYYAEVVKHPSLYTGPQEFKLPPVGTKVFVLDGPNGILQELTGYMLEPAPDNTKIGPDQAGYIHELGAALDTALKKVIENDTDAIVRVNAARVLAHVCRGGSQAHFATLTTMIADPNTRTEIKYYLFHAAGNLLAAYDPNWLKTRNHVGQTDDPKVVGALVKAIDDCVKTPSLLFAGLPDNKADKATPDQLAVIGLVRRQAIKALSHVRFVVMTGSDGKPFYPAYTLARVALSDPALLPAPGPADAAEAVLGLCNMAPVEVKGDRVVPVKYNADVAVEAMTKALDTFASPRAGDPSSRLLPWRNYALRIAEAMRTWRLLFNPDFDITQPNKLPPAGSIPPVVDEFYKDVAAKILAPMDKVDGKGMPDVGATVRIEVLRERLAAIRANPKRGTLLFPDVKETTIDFAAVKK